MTLARPPMVLSTHTNDYVILRYCKIVVTKTARKKILMQTLSLRVTFLLFSRTMKINWLHFIWYADVSFNTRSDYQTFGNILILSTFDHHNFKCGFSQNFNAF